MSMARTTRVLRRFALIFSSLICGPWVASAQTTDSFGELTQEMEPGFRTLRSSEGARENQEPPHAQEAVTDTGCSVRGFLHDTWSETSQFCHGLKAVPRGAVRPGNLEWELPILAATGVLIAKVDRPADNRIQSKSLQQTAGQWSNVGLGLEIGSAALAYGIGCGKHHSYLRDTGFKALAAMGAAGTVDLTLKLVFDHQFPDKSGQHRKVLGRRAILPLRPFSDKFRVCRGGRTPSSGERMRLQPESVSRAIQRKSITPRTSS